ncbi:general transcription factor IIE subunit 2-like [Mercenaria mercenaria]|uniref:general transcription factor IIE subunit 2-like n=1 Tax=Mercenaria mercenaria TaxID=6596 RepID=UPI00234F3F71|nr:general transcription factor IIE subunit 2-like [Mercenaria mercenaria]
MDPALLKERAKFMNRALAQPTVEKRKSKSSHDNDKAKKAKITSSRPKEPKSSNASFDYKTAQGSSQLKFGILAKIVNFMKKRHQDNDSYPLNIDEILDETNQLDVGNKNKHWLVTEALPNNQKIQIIQEDGETKYKYKPTYELKDRKAFLNLLKRCDLHGDGGLLLDDIEESLPHCQQALKKLGDSILYITRPNDKKKILYYNDKYCQFNVDEDFTKLWRGVSVEGQDERKIEEYLEKQGITSMQDVGIKAAPVQKRKKKGGKRSFKKHNEHLAGVLQDYGEFKASKTS